MAQNPALTPYRIQTLDGQAIPAEWGRIQVPENRRNPGANLIEVTFVRVRSHCPDPAPPVFMLPGGPGFSILENLKWLTSMYSIPDFVGDLIVVEQRGVGHSRPSLDCPGTYDLPLEAPLTYDAALAAHRAYIRQAVDFWTDQGVDLQGYNVAEMAADINNLRQALGYDHIQLVGGSFGSHHSLAVLRDFGETISRAVLWGVEGPDHTMKRPRNVQGLLEVLDEYFKQDAYWQKKGPGLVEMMTGVLEFLDRYPVTWEVKDPESGQVRRVMMGKFDLQWITAGGLGNINFIRALPARYYAMAQGDYSWLAESVLQHRIGLESSLAYELIDYASGASPERRALIIAEAPDCLLEDVINETLFDLGDELGNPDVGDHYRGPLHSEVPILLAAGDLDGRTPPANAREILQTLPNGRLVVIAGASHDLARRGEHVTALEQLRNQFLIGARYSETRLATPFRFDSLEGAEG